MTTQSKEVKVIHDWDDSVMSPETFVEKLRASLDELNKEYVRVATRDLQILIVTRDGATLDETTREQRRSVGEREMFRNPVKWKAYQFRIAKVVS